MDPAMLRAVPIFRDLTDEHLDRLQRLLSIRQFRAGERIVAEGTPVNALSIILSGTAHVRRMAQKREVLLSRLGACAIFGEVNLFDPGLATASVVAVSNLDVAQIGYETLRTFMSENPEAGYRILSALMAEVCTRLRLTNQRLVQSVYWSGSPGAQ
jgi:CRP-like cAMP-binding protein